MSPFTQLAEGTLFAGDYRVVRPLNAGAMGAVYLVEQQSTGMPRALKLLLPQLLSDPSLRKRFEQEARVASRIDSEHLVQVIAAGVDAASNTPWLAMELLRGETLGAHVERVGMVPQLQARSFLEQLCHGVAAAHDVAIVHRDLKPENIFLHQAKGVGRDVTVKVLDFGIAKMVSEANTGTSAIGSPMWMAPEQSSRGGNITPATDVWALGLIMFHVLTGRFFWRSAESEDTSIPELFREMFLDPLSPPSSRATQFGRSAALPPGFNQWFLRCVARDPRQRFQHAREAWQAFHGLSGSAAAASSHGRWPTGPTTTVKDAPAPVVHTVLAPPAPVYPQGAMTPVPYSPPVQYPYAPPPQRASTTAGVGMNALPPAPPRPRPKQRPMWPIVLAVTAGIAGIGVVLAVVHPGSGPAQQQLGAPSPSPALRTTGTTGTTGTAKGPGGSKVTSGSGSQRREGLPEGCVDAALGIYLIDQQKGLHVFDPRSAEGGKGATIRDLGRVCPDAKEPNSMALDRSATAWISTVEGSIYKVDTQTLTCEKSAYNPVETGWRIFGMAFSTDVNDPSTEILYLSDTGCTGPGACGRGAALGALDLHTMKLTMLGKYNKGYSGYMGDITGTGDGRLYGFFSKGYGAPTLARIRKRTGEIMSERDQRGLSINGAFCISFSDGYWYMLTQVAGSTSKLTRFKQQGDDHPTVLKEQLGFNVVGAGTSTCQPVGDL